ncbi:MAG: hypothetical protein WBB37_02205 [bacterium]
MNYQGFLTDTLGIPIDDNLDMTFKVFDAASSGNELWSEMQTNVLIERGVFSVLLGSGTSIPDSVFADFTSTWLELTLEGPQTLTPRTRITSVGYAYTATYSDTALFARNAAADNDWSFLVSDGADTTLQTGGQWGIARTGNTLYGNADSTYVNFGVACTTGTNGQNYRYCTVGGGHYNSAGGGFSATVSGGDYNKANGNRATVGGGQSNTASGWCATVSGGIFNTASNWHATVGGGEQNGAGNQYATVGGGRQNTASGWIATVSGGWGNTASSDRATVSGGEANMASDQYTTVGGGQANMASSVHATVAGGRENTASGYAAIVGGGWGNTASGYCATVGGGGDNDAGEYATVGGGGFNDVAGTYSAILGGYADTIFTGADYSYLFGINSNLTQDSTFMVDLPHIRFGTEAAGYEFPTTDGTNGQALVTDGSGQVSWAATNDNDWSFLVSDGADTTLQMGGRWGLTRPGNVLYGNADSTHVNLGVVCTTGTVGNDFKFSTVSGGFYNTASGHSSTVSGGEFNTASGWGATVDGGRLNRASGYIATVGGGHFNKARGQFSVISGGGGATEADSNSAIGDYSAIGGGYRNIAVGNSAVIGGGYGNKTSVNAATIGGGRDNTANGDRATVGGGNANNAGNQFVTIGGGTGNNASGNTATVGGGNTNTASGEYATVGAGVGNTASGNFTVVGGGWSNSASGNGANVTGGYYNSNAGDWSSILGGYADTIFAGANYSYLFGINSNLTQDSTFMVDLPHIRFGTEAAGYEFPTTDGTNGQALVTDGSGQVSWGSTNDDDWTVSGSNMYSAVSGNVGIGTTTPSAKLNVWNGNISVSNGGVLSNTGYWGDALRTNWGNDLTLVSSYADKGILFRTQSGEKMRIDADGNVGIGTTGPAEKLDVAGTAQVTGFKMPTGATNGYVLTSDVSGIGTWQNVSADSDWSFLISNGADTTLQTGGRWGIARAGNTLYGNADSTHVNLGIDSRTGANETANYKYCTVGGGYNNSAYLYATVAGGGNNAAAEYGTVAGGYYNSATNLYAAVVGGDHNTASGQFTFVGGGQYNIANVDFSTVVSGSSNIASGIYATVGGGQFNKARGQYSVVSGGGGPNAADSNSAIGNYSAIGGGRNNIASVEGATVGGGLRNTASGMRATVGGGLDNTASGLRATVGGGYLNTASLQQATVGGGYNNTASGVDATVGGGEGNTASDSFNFIGGGYQNLVAGKYSAILCGYADTITATGDYSYLFGINSNLTQDSTFMVDLPHIRFGNETNGYEFPTTDGSADQVMVTNGSGQLSWADQVAGADTDWVFSGNDIYSGVTGNVGIGTTNPAVKLDVNGTINADDIVCTNMTALGDIYAADDAVFGGRIDIGMDGYISGNLGVGVSSPSSKIHIAGMGAACAIQIDGSGSSGYFYNDASGLHIKSYDASNLRQIRFHTGSDWTPEMVILADGNVGIGTTNPAVKLDVNGTINADDIVCTNVTALGDIYAADDAVFSGNIDVGMDGTFNGTVSAATGISTAMLYVNGTTGYNQICMRTSYSPTGTSDPNGSTGDIAWDDSYMYVKTSIGWKRAQLSSW